MERSREPLRWLRDLLHAPDDGPLLDAGVGGERSIAWWRLLAVFVLLLGAGLAAAAGWPGAGAVCAIALPFLALAGAWLVLARRAQPQGWLRFATTATDVSLVTALLLATLAPAPWFPAATALFPFYLLALLLTALRHDGRTTLFAGTLAIVQFLALAGGLAFPLGGGPAGLATTAAAIAAKTAILIAATALTLVIVERVRRLVDDAGIDRLTGLPNRSYLGLQLPRLLAQARRERDSLTLAMIDVDRFARLNEDYGHVAGDHALRRLSRQLRDACGPGSVLVRIGGQEFLAVLPLPMGAAWEHIERVREAVAAMEFVPEPGHEPVRLTISTGLACYPHDADSVPGLLKRADLRLRGAKLGGRNRSHARD